MFPHTVTIYNKYVEDRIEKWQRTVLRGVFWDSSKGAVIRKTGVASADGLMLIIPMSIRPVFTALRWLMTEDHLQFCDNNDALVLVPEQWKSRFVTPKEWASMTDRSEKWTIQSGDIVVLGEIVYEIVKSSKELQQQFDNVMIVNSVDARNHGSGMDHWEVSGR